MAPWRWQVNGFDPSPDGYHDHTMYRGDSALGALKAWRAGRKQGMTLTVTRYENRK